MNAARLVYRSRQFFQTLISSAAAVDLEPAALVLSPSQLALFRRMPAGEQAHALRVLSDLTSLGETDPDLLTAALLHDIGKVLAPLRVWERVLIVLVGGVCPRCLLRWGSQAGLRPGESVERMGLRRALVVAVQHPAWGAELAASCGTSPRAVELIRRHQDEFDPTDDRHSEIVLLRKLQQVDDNN
jgi:putative nucleotidyltransferase with HDIG domain